jgi:hypothetical protein
MDILDECVTSNFRVEEFSSNLNMGAAGLSEMFVPAYQTTQHHDPEDHKSYLYNFKLSITKFSVIINFIKI